MVLNLITDFTLNCLCSQASKVRSQGRDHSQGALMEQEFGSEIMFRPQKGVNRDEAVLVMCGIEADSSR